MNEAARQTRSYLLELFERHGFHPRGDLGQNFLIDINLIDFIVHSADLEPRDVVLEIGAGTGGMTAFLAQRAGAVVSVEYDEHMFGLCSETVRECPNVALLHCDALRNKNHLADEVLDAVRARLAEDPERRLKLVANLPYNIATPVITNLVATDLPWKAMVVTIQWELALRMRARPRTSEYGALAAWIQSQCWVKVLKRMPPNVFWPRPKVDSAIVRLYPDPRAAKRIEDRAFFHDFVRRLFHHRRKFLRSVLVGMYSQQLEKPEVDAVLREMGYKEGARAEELDVRQLVELSNTVAKRLQAAGFGLQESGVRDADAEDEDAHSPDVVAAPPTPALPPRGGEGENSRV